MPVAASIRWSGGRELAQALRELPALVATETLESAAVAGAGIVRAAAAAKAPRSLLRRRPRSPRLADTIRVEIQEKDRAHVRVAIVSKAPFAHLVEYGHDIIARGPGRKALGSQQRIKRAVGVRWKIVRRKRKDGSVVEKTVLLTKQRSFVTGMHAELRSKLLDRRRAGAIGHVAAEPFLRPAFDETKDAVLARMSQVIGKSIEEHYRRVSTPQGPAKAAA